MFADVPLSLWGPWPPGDGWRRSQKLKNGGLIRAVDSYHFYFSQRFQMWFNM